jgi:hypothetical protein
MDSGHPMVVREQDYVLLLSKCELSCRPNCAILASVERFAFGETLVQKYEQAVRSAAESLYGDERLRSNLTDGAAKVILDWAVAWVAGQVNGARDELGAKQIAQNELTRVRQVASALNALAAKNTTPRLDEAIAVIRASASTSASFTSEQVLSLATTFTAALWKNRERSNPS